MAERVLKSAEATSLDRLDIKPWDRTDFIPRHDGWNVFPFMVSTQESHVKVLG